MKNLIVFFLYRFSTLSEVGDFRPFCTDYLEDIFHMCHRCDFKNICASGHNSNNCRCYIILKQTSFKNPHGLTAAGHKSTARDLTKLAFFAYQLPHFADYVRTRQRGCTLVGADEKKRNVIWKNTNRLLGTEGYLGIKTGTTTAAGACLISLSEREGRTILLVTLGSAASASRYADARNLHRYLWQQRLATELELR